MRFVTLSVLALVTALGGVVHAEDTTRKVGRFRLTTLDGNMIEGNYGYIAADSLFFRHRDNTHDAVALGEISNLRRHRGDLRTPFSAMGALTGLVIGTSGERSSGVTDSEAYATIGYIVSGMVLGYLAGSGIVLWDEVPLSVSVSGDTATGTRCVVVSLGL